MKIKKLKITNVGNIDKAEYDLDDFNAFDADNGVGKTNTLNSLAYLLMGRIFTDNAKNENEFTDLIPNDDSKKVCFVEVELENGATLGFKFYNKYIKQRGSTEETFTGRTTEWYFNGVKCRNTTEFMTEFNNVFGLENLSQIKVNDSKFNPRALLCDVFYAFTKIDYKILREIIIHFVGDVSFNEMCAKNSEYLVLSRDNEKYNGRFDIARKNYWSMQNELKKQIIIKQEVIDNIVTDYDENKLNMLNERMNELLTEKIKLNNTSELDAKKQEVEMLKEKWLDSKQNDLSKNKNQELETAEKEVFKVQNAVIEAKNLETNLSHRISLIKMKGASQKSVYDSIDSKIDILLKQFNDLNSSENNLEELCPNCGYVLNQSENEQYKLQKTKRLEEIKKDIENNKVLKEQILQESKALAKDMKIENSQLLVATNNRIELEKQLNDIKTKYNALKTKPITISETTKELEQQYLQALSELDANTLKLEEERKEAKLKNEEERKAVEAELGILNGAKANVNRKNVFEAELHNLVKELNDCESKYILCDNYIKKRIRLISETTKEKFGIEFKLLEEQVNGGLTEVCYPIYDGKEYQKLNRGLKEVVGAKFIKSIENLLGIKEYPIIIDNAESLGNSSVNQLKELGNQLIITRVRNQNEVTLSRN